MDNPFGRCSRLPRIVAALALIAGIGDARASGTLFRSYLSVNGADSNPCTLPLPCRLLPAALAATADAGEVWILDSANYNTGAVTISQSVTILAVPGALGSLVGNGGDALDVTGSNLKVNLRNLSFRYLSGSFIAGIYFNATASQLTVENSQFNGLYYGVIVTGAGVATISSSSFLHNNYAVSVSGIGTSSFATLDHCTIEDSVGSGVSARNGYLSLTHSIVSDSAIAVEADSAGHILLGADSFSHNAILASFLGGGGSVYSAKNNHTYAVPVLEQGGTIDRSYGTF